MPVASYKWQKMPEIRRVLCLCMVSDNTVLASCLGSTDLFELIVEGDAIHVANLYNIGLQSPPIFLQYAATLNLVFALTEERLLVTQLSHKFNEMTHPINQFVPAYVSSFDIVIVKSGVLVALMDDEEVSIVLCTNDDAFLISRFHVGSCVSCKWLTAVCLSCNEFGKLNLYCVSGNVLQSFGSSTKPVVKAGPLQESFSYDDKTKVYTRNKKFFVLFDGFGAYFPYCVKIYSQDQNCVTELLVFPIFATSLPKCVFSVGPWICVGGDFGIEFYEYGNGFLVQSTLETITVQGTSFSHFALDLRPVPNDYMYSKSRHGIALTNEHIYTLCVHSIVDVVDELKADPALNAGIIESLIAYGRSVQAKVITRLSCKCDAVQTSNVFVADYASILEKFRLPTAHISSQSSNVLGKKNADLVCVICRRKSSSFISQFYKCAICKVMICKKCSFVRHLERYGYNFADGCCVVCADCDGTCDFNLYRLFMARRFSQIMLYMQRYPVNCSKLTPSEVISSILQQCFHERKYDLCANMLKTYVPMDDHLWSFWITRFGMAKQMGSIVCVYDPSFASKTINTGLLLQLIKNESDVLYCLLQRWSKTSYNTEILLKGVLSRLLYKKGEAKSLQLSCQTSSLTVSQVHNAVSDLYFDDEIISLLRVMLSICLKNKLFEDAAKGYMEYFIMMLPFPHESEIFRRRTCEIFDDNVLSLENARAFQLPHLIDFWDLISSHGILESFIHLKDVSGSTYFLIPLLIHFPEEFGQYLINSAPVSFLENFLKEVVNELRENQPNQLLHILDALGSIQPRSIVGYHPLMSELYMNYAPEKLFLFLQNPLVSGLDWKKLAKSAEKLKMFREFVYIIGKIGNDKEAVHMAIRCMKSVSLALEYMKDHDDPRLKSFFVTNVIQSPLLIGDFLEIADSCVSVEEVLREIPLENRIEIDHVGPRLHKIFLSKRSIRDISKSAVSAINEDTYVSMVTLRKGNCRAARCEPSYFCSLCGQSILGDYVVNGSGQPFHITCGQSGLATWSPIHKKRIRSMQSRQKHESEVLENDFVEHLDSRHLGFSKVLLPLTEVQVHYILSFLTFEQREVCRGVSRGFRKIVKKFYCLIKGEGENLYGRYRVRVESKQGMPCRKTILLPGVTSFS